MYDNSFLWILSVCSYLGTSLAYSCSYHLNTPYFFFLSFALSLILSFFPHFSLILKPSKLLYSPTLINQSKIWHLVFFFF